MAAGQGEASDLFSLLRTRLRAEPELLEAAWRRADTDRDGKLTPQQVCSRCAPGRLRVPGRGGGGGRGARERSKGGAPLQAGEAGGVGGVGRHASVAAEPPA